ncbi:MAG: hypothetical protein WBP61_01150 [Nocardioides sp.]
MLFVVIAMLVALVVAALVVVYVAYPHRGEQMPAFPWLGDAMTRAVGSAPLVEPEYEDSDRGR